MNDGRPDPDDLLERYGLAMRPQVHGRGRLRIFFGAAPGTGKTYAMLQEGNRLLATGQDVVIGLVETHGRAETEAQLGDLERLPRRRVAYRGVEIEELDVAAIIERGPDVVLVDELAHTNAPGSLRPKRWQDVEVIRDAGIDVLSTVNVQHIESLNQIVESITGVAVRETIPDHVLESATELQLVDIPVEALIERLESGHVYPPDRARQALQNFFRPGNLTALRELALRQTAAGVDQRLEQYMHAHQIADVWPAAERVAVLVGEYPAEALIRVAWRISSVFRSELLVMSAEKGGATLEKNRAFAEDLGATIRTMPGRNVALELAKALQGENVGFLVLPNSAAKRRWPWSPSIVERLFDLLDNVHIQLVEQDHEDRRGSRQTRSGD